MFSARTLAALLPESWFRRTKRTCHLLAKHPRLEPCCSEGTLGWGSPRHPAPPLCPLPSAAHPRGACQRVPGCASFALILAGDMVCVERPPLTSCLGTLQGGVLAQSHLLPEAPPGSCSRCSCSHPSPSRAQSFPSGVNPSFTRASAWEGRAATTGLQGRSRRRRKSGELPSLVGLVSGFLKLVKLGYFFLLLFFFF